MERRPLTTLRCLSYFGFEDTCRYVIFGPPWDQEKLYFVVSFLVVSSLTKSTVLRVQIRCTSSSDQGRSPSFTSYFLLSDGNTPTSNLLSTSECSEGKKSRIGKKNGRLRRNPSWDPVVDRTAPKLRTNNEGTLGLFPFIFVDIGRVVTLEQDT